MAFLRSVWSIMVGIKDALVLLALVLFFGLLWAAFSFQAPGASVPDGAALVLNLEGSLVDQAQEVSPFAFLSGQEIIPEIEVRDLVQAIDTAKDDKAIKMIVMDLDGFMGGGLANLETVGAALARFRASGKTVESYAVGYADDGYYLASHANKIWLSPLGAVVLTGPGGNNLYFKEALDKLKVNIEVFRVGTYKSFVEPFTRNESSPEAKAANQVLADDLWLSYRTGVQAQRKNLDLQALLANWQARVTGANKGQAELALDAGLVDGLAGKSDYASDLQTRLGPGDDENMPGDFKRVSFQEYLAAREDLTESGDAIAVVNVSGSIVDGEAPAGQAGGNTVAGLIDEATADPDIKALVIRVDSGGGSVLASERIREAILAAKKRDMPVVASFGPVAASGGYWLATAADAIYAQPSTITGSIGVFGIIPTFEKSLKEIGISADGVTTTPFSGQPDIVGGLNEPTRALFQAGVVDTYRRFVGLVAESRKLPVAQVEQMAEGRVWSGKRALDLKLIDGFGDLAFAIKEAGKRAKLDPDARVVVMRTELPFLGRLFADLNGGTAPPVDAMAQQVLASRARAISQVQTAVSIASGPSIQAHCLTCVSHAPPRNGGKAMDLAALAAKLLD